jgi:Ca2+-transporting ATPase
MSVIIFGVIVVNAIIGTIQETKAEKALEALKKLSSPTATVRRDGKLVEVKAEELVPGDIVVLEEGRTVPADLRLDQSLPDEGR